jgi:hypothetical protein
VLFPVEVQVAVAHELLRHRSFAVLADHGRAEPCDPQQLGPLGFGERDGLGVAGPGHRSVLAIDGVERREHLDPPLRIVLGDCRCNGRRGQEQAGNDDSTGPDGV